MKKLKKHFNDKLWFVSFKKDSYILYSNSLNLDSAVLSGYRYYNKNAVKHYADVIRCDILEKFHSLK